MIGSLKKKIASSVFGSEKPEKTAEYVPYDLVCGSKVLISSNVDIIHDSLFKKRREGYYVNRIGQFSQKKATIFRIYLAETADSEDLTAFIQVSTRKDLKGVPVIEETLIFNEVEEQFPMDEDEWKFWIGSETSKGVVLGAIGKIGASFAEREFSRMDSWAAVDVDWAKPQHLDESLTDTATFSEASREMHLIHDAMLYGRWLSEELSVPEYLLLSSITYRNNNELVYDKIGIYAGIGISQTDIVKKF